MFSLTNHQTHQDYCMCYKYLADAVWMYGAGSNAG